MLLGFAAASAQTALPPWPMKHYATFSTSAKVIDTQEDAPAKAVLRWYNYEILRMKDHEMWEDGVGNTTLFVPNPLLGSTAYMYSVEKQTCEGFFAPVNIIAPGWMTDGELIDREEFDGNVYNKWDKQDHFLYQSENNRQPKGVYAPVDQAGRDITYHFAEFYPMPSLSEKEFEIPAYCDQNLEGMRKLSKEEVWTVLGKVATPWGIL